jgi:hypothetical protein
MLAIAFRDPAAIAEPHPALRALQDLAGEIASSLPAHLPLH